MKRIHLTHNEITGQYIIDPYNASRKEFRDFNSVKEYLTKRYKKRKLELYTDILEEEIMKLKESIQIEKVKK